MVGHLQCATRVTTTAGSISSVAGGPSRTRAAQRIVLTASSRVFTAGGQGRHRRISDVLRKSFCWKWAGPRTLEPVMVRIDRPRPPAGAAVAPRLAPSMESLQRAVKSSPRCSTARPWASKRHSHHWGGRRRLSSGARLARVSDRANAGLAGVKPATAHSLVRRAAPASRWWEACCGDACLPDRPQSVESHA